MARKFNINAKTIIAPLAAFTMAGILFVYSRTSIQAAKRNAQKHREADGGQINWHNETLRRHGKLEPPEDQSTVKQLAGLVKEKTGRRSGVGSDGAQSGETEAERIIRDRTGKTRTGR